MTEDLLAFIDQTVDDAIQDLGRLIALPSVAAKGEHMEETAQLVAEMLRGVGSETKIHETSGCPVVTGEIDVGAERTLLCYDHYDVQPAEPFDLWESPPFEMSVRGDRIYGRGVADNKGDFVTRLWAVKAFQETGTEIPVNLKFVVEGEEEISSPHLYEFVEDNREWLKADGGIWEFGGSGIDGKQEAWLGLKGILYVQLEVEALSHDAHSSLACVLPSAASRLVWALSSLKGADEHIMIDDFYDGIKPLTHAELEALSIIEMREEDVKKHYGITSFILGLEGDELKERYYNGPTCNICGIDTGYQGEGSKTVLPAKATAKIDFRLVEGMDPDTVLKGLRIHLDQHGFSDVKIAWHEGYPAAKTPVGHPFVELVSKANEEVFGHRLTLQPTSPGSGPLYLFDALVPMVSIGCGDFESRAHSPNETILIDNFQKTIKRMVVLIEMMKDY
ncbi:M20/M25/M40 family metallo-hydrolase [Candidatus Thorarchaeota archaeon]|nr:MAG: M20/M25/M40 family metallo-hydrolase [Candidatus Thorarchaeota archaeon]